ncbi:lysoplasmalogenase [Ruania suaedae]|uniref:lysoplasmalogenase n=1 Tax=Ruania suaedae TaxID=2897774 RepID=UPI001E51EE45|nr:lysoplasmalogenase [Ruania suaedae]UFU01619.1 lysoplasmalogenase [Ruania suaedae]
MSGHRAWDVAFVLVAAVHLLAQAVGAEVLADGSQVLLVPALAGAVWSRAGLPHHSPALRGYACALLFSWIGDAAPRVLAGDAGFVAMVSAFLVAQACFLVTFSVLRRARLSWWVVLGYLAGFVALFAASVTGAADLLPLVALYGVVLVAAATFATTVNLVVGLGGVLFFVSDTLIALEVFSSWYEAPAHDLLVMTTYIAAQVLFAAGLLRRWGAAAGPQPPQPSPATGASSALPEPSRRSSSSGSSTG